LDGLRGEEEKRSVGIMKVALTRPRSPELESGGSAFGGHGVGSFFCLPGGSCLLELTPTLVRDEWLRDRSGSLKFSTIMQLEKRKRMRNRGMALGLGTCRLQQLGAAQTNTFDKLANYK
jgi:hypothetical protein